MSKTFLACLCSLLVFTALSLIPDNADAARIGGGRSFGGRPSMSQTYSRPTQMPSTTMSRQQTRMAQPGMATPSRSGMFGGMGGMLGGLLAGGLIGSLLFGGHGGMGGGGGVGLFEIILLAAIAYFAWKFFASRRRAQNNRDVYGQPAGYDNVESIPYQRVERPDYGTSQYADTSNNGWSTLQGGGGQYQNNVINLPANFDEEEFLRGARAAYLRLNSSWDKRDLNDIAQFATPAFMTEMRQQNAEDPTPCVTEIVMINNLSIIEAKEDAGDQMISVYFDVLLREDPNQKTPSDIREVWHFVRPISGNGTWKLDGIQQVARA